MKKKKEYQLQDFKIDDKVWYTTQHIKGKIPGIIKDKKIQSVGKVRDALIYGGMAPYQWFEDTSIVSRRKKIFPGEDKRLRLSETGLEEEYVNMKKRREKIKNLTLTEHEHELLNSIRKNYSQGAYEIHYLNRGFTQREIDNLVDMGIVYKTVGSLRFVSLSFLDRKILVPTGETYR